MKILLKILAWAVAIILIIFVIPLPKVKRVATPAYQISDLKFPKNFYFGASTAAHQVEGGSSDNWTVWEKDNASRLAAEAESKFKSDVPNWDAIKVQATDPQNYISGKADDEYNLYPQDIKLMQQIGLNSYRFSIDWAKIEPKNGQFDQSVMDHYIAEVKALRAAGIEPFVTLWHRAEPVWVSDQGDWENQKTVNDFVKFADFAAKNFGSKVKYYMTFNEPELHIVAGYIEGTLPPEVKSYSRGKVALNNMIDAHKKAYQIIHSDNPEAQVGSTVADQLAEGSPSTIANNLVAKYLQDQANWKFLDATKDQTDFVGLQYYSISEYTLHFGGKGIVGVQTFHNQLAPVRSDMGWEVYPYGIYDLLKQTYQRYKKPIIITENGIADAGDSLRAKFISDHLYWVQKAIADGVDVRGYMYWSLLDNFEWDKGFWPEFGLIHVDFSTEQQTLRASALVYKQIISQK